MRKYTNVYCGECAEYVPYEWMNGIGWCETKEHGMMQDDSCEDGREKDE